MAKTSDLFIFLGVKITFSAPAVELGSELSAIFT